MTNSTLKKTYYSYESSLSIDVISIFHSITVYNDSLHQNRKMCKNRMVASSVCRLGSLSALETFVTTWPIPYQNHPRYIECAGDKDSCHDADVSNRGYCLW